MQVSDRVGVTSGRALALLVTAAVALSVGFVVAPAALAGGGYGTFYDNRPLVDSLKVNFAEYWRAGTGNQSPGLQDIVDYWARYHVAKALLAALLLGVLIALGIQLWRGFLKARNPTPFAAGGGLVAALSAFALMLVIANIQGALAPLSSLLPLLPTVEFERVGRALANLNTSNQNLALAAIETEFVRYHAILAVTATLVAVLLSTASVLSWRSFAKTTDSRVRRSAAAIGIFLTVLVLGLLVVIAANVSTAVAPTEPLRNFFGAG
ncbi:hypothetical protein L1080_032510 [Rhodococcus sp. MSC1_016]|uniref:hypothetical protein n=1 Tax=Rhodococcus sp. MSC1_016 TaxID=2909266 RepID=UPI00202E26AB|nr:hypothetical protein [Rhodococcus sp. MSC1_016]